jgi:hypothetical protein
MFTLDAINQDTDQWNTAGIDIAHELCSIQAVQQ